MPGASDVAPAEGGRRVAEVGAQPAGSGRAVAGDGWAADGAVIAEIAERVARSTSAWFLVDSLDHLRRGGRISGPAAAFGTVLGLRPVLTLRDGRIEVTERVRTRRAARDRLVDLVLAEVARRVGGPVAGAGERSEDGGAAARGSRGRGARPLAGPHLPAPGSAGGAEQRRGVRVAVQHLGRAEVAEQIAERVRAATGLDPEDVLVREVGAVLGGHLGPGALAVMVTDR
jgi:fatty acid-binding protein DegV